MRVPHPATGKIVNRLAGTLASPLSDASRSLWTPTGPAAMSLTGGVPIESVNALAVPLMSAADAENFAYAGELRVSEDEVKRALEALPAVFEAVAGRLAAHCCSCCMNTPHGLAWNLGALSIRDLRAGR